MNNQSSHSSRCFQRIHTMRPRTQTERKLLAFTDRPAACSPINRPAMQPWSCRAHHSDPRALCISPPTPFAPLAAPAMPLPHAAHAAHAMPQAATICLCFWLHNTSHPHIPLPCKMLTRARSHVRCITFARSSASISPADAMARSSAVSFSSISACKVVI